MGLRLLKVNFPWLGLTGPDPGSLLVEAAVETTAAAETLSGPGLVLGVVELSGLSWSGVVGGKKPWMVLETRAETVTKLRSGEAGRLCGLVVEVVELSEEEVAVRGGFAPFSHTAGGVFTEPVGV